MPIQGYIGKKPDAEWWLEQIHAGERYRDHVVDKNKWNDWRKMYRGQWRPGVMPLNLFFTMIRTVVPRIYFRNPAAVVSAGSPGLLSAVFARQLERMDSKLIKQMKVKNAFKRAIQDTFMFGSGYLKLGFGGEFSPSLDSSSEGLLFGEERVEYGHDFMPNRPWLKRVRPENMVLPAKCETFDESRWYAEKITRPVEDVIKDPRFTDTKDLSLNREVVVDAGGFHRVEKVIDLWEVHDKKLGVVFLLAPTKGGRWKHIFMDEDVFVTRYGRVQYSQLLFNEDDEHCWGIPDSRILEPYQLEINEIKTQTMKHRRASIIKIGAKEGSIDDAEIDKMLSEDVSAVFKTKENPNTSIQLIQQGTIPRELFTAADIVMQDTKETVGFSRNEFGEFNSRSGDTTATEARIVRQASEIRVDERRDDVADAFGEILPLMHQMLFDMWSPRDVVDIIGPGGGRVWTFLSPQLMRRGRYIVNVDPDSALPETRATREARAVQLYQLLLQNPFVDPVKLTSHLLTEIKGPVFDDLLRLIPGVTIGADPVSPEQFPSLVQKSLSELPGQQAGQQRQAFPTQQNQTNEGDENANV